MSAELHVTPARATNSNGLNLDGAKWFFYLTGTSTPESVFTTADLDVAHTNPVVADAAGKFAPIYFDSTKQYRGVLKTADEGTTIYDIDPINAGVMSQLAASGGSELVGFLQAGTNAIARTAQAKMRESVTSSDFNTLADAITYWAANGGRLVINQDYTLTSAITANLTASKSYILECDRERTITYDGSSVLAVLRINGANNTPLMVSPLLTIDAANKANSALWVNYETVTGSNRAKIDIGGTYKNARRETGLTFRDAVPISVTGGFIDLHMHDVRAINSTRAAGSGTPGSTGNIGIGVYVWCPKILIEDFYIENVNSDDLPSSANRSDLDGLLLFQDPQETSFTPAVIQRGTIVEAAIRAIKAFAPAGGVHISNITVIRSIVGGFNGSDDIDVQSGDGIVENIKFYYSGDANTKETTPIDIGANGARTVDYAFHPTIVRNVIINDKTGVAKRQIVGTFSNFTDNDTRQILIENVVDTGTAEVVTYIGALGINGGGRATLRVRDMDCNVTVGFTKSEDDLSNLYVEATGLRNRGSSVPAITNNSGVQRSNLTLNWGQFWSDESLVGFHRDTGAWPQATGFLNGFRGPGGGAESACPAGKSTASGRVDTGTVTQAENTTVILPAVGMYDSTGGNYSFNFYWANRNGAGRFVTTAGSTAITTLEAMSSGDALDINSTGAAASVTNPEIYKGADGRLRMWLPTGTGTRQWRIVFNP